MRKKNDDGTFAYGLEARDAAMAKVNGFIASNGFSANDAVIFTGDTNFRVDNTGEQLRRMMNDPNADAYRGWVEPRYPSYYTCRFAEQDQCVNTDAPSYLACRSGNANGLKLVTQADVLAAVNGGPKEPRFNFALQGVSAAFEFFRVHYAFCVTLH